MELMIAFPGDPRGCTGGGARIAVHVGHTGTHRPTAAGGCKMRITLEHFGLGPIFRGKVLVGRICIERRKRKSLRRVEWVSRGRGWLEEKVVRGVGHGEARRDGSRVGRHIGDIGARIVAWAYGGCLAVEFDIGASALALNAFH